MTNPARLLAAIATIGFAVALTSICNVCAQVGTASGTAVGKVTDQTPAWHYDLRSGDHLTYRYTFRRQTQSKEEQSEVEAHFLTHVLAVGSTAERISLGFQRNREAAELTEFRSGGKSRLADEQKNFRIRMQKRPARFSEAMEISPGGEPRYFWEVARETSMRLLDSFHEVMNLPPIQVTKGGVWRNSPILGLDLRWADDESIHGKLCHHIEGELLSGALKLSYWWSPESGVLEQVVLDESYVDHGRNLHETARMELESKVRGEHLENWLGSADTRQGALQAVLLTPGVPISAKQLSPVFLTDDPTSQALALAIAFRDKIELPPDLISKLRQSGSDQVKQMAGSLSGFITQKTDECSQAQPEILQPSKYGSALEVAPEARKGYEIPYGLRVPLTYRGSSGTPAPLLVYLSGGAGFAIDGVNTAEDVVAGTDYIVLYPQASEYWWTPQGARRFDTVLNSVLQRYNVDRDRIYLTGFSNGATGALYLAELWPHRFAAVVSLMGAGECNDQVKTGLPGLKNLPLLFVHGESDPIISPNCSTITQTVLTELGSSIRPQLKILPNREHDITLQSDDNLTLAFFKGKLRNPFPREVEINLSDALAARSYWIEIVDGIPGKSHLEAHVKSSNTIEIHSRDVKKVRLHLRPELFPKPGDFSIVWNGKKMLTGPLRDRCSQPPTGDPKLDQADTRDLELPIGRS